MAMKRINVLVYSGTGASVDSVRHCLISLRKLLSPNYAVLPITGDTIVKEPWAPSCALLVFPGGADLGYGRALNREGNRRIRNYVSNGGSYLGFCAGGYYGCSRCEFEVGDEKLEVVGERELAFFPGTCRGSSFKGFVYNSESGTKAAELKVLKTSFAAGGTLPEVFRCYFNGGGVFVDAENYGASGIEVLATHNQAIAVEPKHNAAAVVFCKVGEGSAILTGPHPEFAAANLSKDAKGIDPAVVDALAEDDIPRNDFLKACLLKLGLRVTTTETETPSLSPIYFSSSRPSGVADVLKSFEQVVTVIEGEKYLKGENDTFQLQESSSAWSMSNLTRAALETLQGIAGTGTSATQSKTDKAAAAASSSAASPTEDQTIKPIISWSESIPSSKETPYFNQEAYFSALHSCTAAKRNSANIIPFGTHLLYAQVTTSTSTLLEKNPTLTNKLPAGSTLTATTQLSGRGRGANVWVSPPGSLMFSTVFTHPLSLNARAPLVFVQYLAALAVADAVATYDPHDSRYATLPLRLKWPNDIYALDPARGLQTHTDAAADHVKIGGILVNTSYAGGDYHVVLGIGLNVSNASPTSSLNALVAAYNARNPAAKPLQPFTLERLLARILVSFGRIYDVFKANGFAGDLEAQYYRHWLHAGQIVTLETEGGVRARIKGVTTDWGLLLAEEVGGEAGRERSTGRTFALQSDSNSFDFFKGLVKRKL